MPTSAAHLTSAPSGITSVVAWFARQATRWPKTAIVLWIALVAGCIAWGAATGVRSLSSTADAIGDSGRAAALVRDAGLGEPPTEVVLIKASDAAMARRAAAALQLQLQQQRGITGVASALPNGGGIRSLSADGGRALLVQATIAEAKTAAPADADEASEAATAAGARRVAAAVTATRRTHPDASYAQTGAGSVEAAINDMVEQDLQRAELLSVPLTLLILVFVFGALMAASVPLILGLTSVAAAMGALGPLSQLVPMGDSVGALVVLIGLAVGVDYSLFYVRREREERASGAGPDAALHAAVASVGRAIVVSGVIVMLSLAGLLLTGVGEFTAMAAGTMLVVAIAVVGSLTVLPAMLALLGDRIDAGRILGRRRALARRDAARLAAACGVQLPAPRPSAWGRIAGSAARRPAVTLGIASVVLLTIAAPATQLKLGDSGTNSLPKTIPAVAAAIEIDATFPGGPQAAQLVVAGVGLESSQAREQLQALAGRARQITGGVGAPQLRVSRDGTVAAISVPMPDRSAQASDQLVRDLRAGLRGAELPAGGDRLLIAGNAAASLDFSAAVRRAMPLVAAFVLGLALLLLRATFGTWRLAFTVVALNLLSIAAAYGVMVLVFQGSWAESLLDFTSSGAITTWLPLIAFVVLFGLSMDYSILVLERIREERAAGYAPREAAARGVAATAGTVTGAALVMVGVFSIFATLRMLEMKQLGIGLATAATIIRAFALPAAVGLLGPRAFGRGARDSAAPAPAAARDEQRAVLWDDAGDAAREIVDA